MAGDPGPTFGEADLDPDPIVMFARWFAAAGESGEPEPEAMSLATADAAGRPSVRVVLMRQFDESGFVFYTNGLSRKGREMAANPFAALAFRWPVLDRQVRICGPVAAIDGAQSDRYFAGRPRGSQLGAWASEQSEPIETKEPLVSRLAEVTDRFADLDVPRPSWWGGYRVMPTEIEFWQQGPYRLHDRFRYSLEAGRWSWRRLNP